MLIQRKFAGDVVMTTEPTTVSAGYPQGHPQAGEPPAGAGSAELALEDRFSMVPEWVLDADIGDCALRLYAMLLRYGNTTGARMPARTTLAARLHKKSTDTVDRATTALLHVAADPATRSPARLAEAGPWWDRPEAATTAQPAGPDVAALEAELDTVDGQRLALQQRARQQLSTERHPVTRAAVIQRAAELLRTKP